MKPDPCPHGESTLRAARAGRWTDELTAHVATCVSCQESSRLARWMIELAETADSASLPLPDPHLIWLKAQIHRRSEGRERALLPIKIGRALAVVGLGAACASIPDQAWSWGNEWLPSGSALVSGLPKLLSLSPLIISWMPTGLLVIVLLLFTASEA